MGEEYIIEKVSVLPPDGDYWKTKETEDGYIRIAILEGADFILPNGRKMAFRKNAEIRFVVGPKETTMNFDVKDVISNV